jgi:hypothetical protein
MYFHFLQSLATARGRYADWFSTYGEFAATRGWASPGQVIRQSAMSYFQLRTLFLLPDGEAALPIYSGTFQDAAPLSPNRDPIEDAWALSTATSVFDDRKSKAADFPAFRNLDEESEDESEEEWLGFADEEGDTDNVSEDDEMPLGPKIPAEGQRQFRLILEQIQLASPRPQETGKAEVKGSGC